MRTSPIRRLLCLLAFTGLATAPARGADQYALLVAAAAYPHLKHLKYTCDDLVDFRKALLGSGFQEDHVVLMYDGQAKSDLKPEIKNIRSQLKLVLGKAGPDDTVIVALSGHGVDFVDEKRSYYCPLDANLLDKTTLLDVDDLYDTLKACRAVRKLLLVDACRDDPRVEVNGKVLEKLELQSLTRPELTDVPEGIVAVFSCSPKEKSWESDDLNHGIFFYNFLEGWRGKAAHDGKVTVDGVIEYTMSATQAYAHDKFNQLQRPQRKNEFSGVWVLNDAINPITEVGFETTKVDGPMTLKGHSDAVLCVASSGDGKYVAGGSADRTVKVWNTTTGKVERSFDCNGPAVSMAFDPHGRYLAVGCGDDAVRVWDCKTGSLLWSKADLAACAKGVAFSPNGESLAVTAGTVYVMTAATGQELWHYGDTAVFQAVAYSPSGERLAAGSFRGRLAVFTAAGEPVKSVQAHADGGVSVLAYSPDGAWLVSGSSDKTVKVFDAAKMREHGALKGHDGGVRCLSFSADGKCLVTSSDDKTMTIWDLSTGNVKLSLPGHGGDGLAACFSPDAKHIAVAAPDHTVRVWSVDLTK